MRKFILVSLFLLSITSFSQTEDDTADNLPPKTDSITEQVKQISDSIPINEPGYSGIDMDRNMQYMLDIQKKNVAKKRRSAMIRIGIGVAFLIILVIGLSRKVKTKRD